MKSIAIFVLTTLLLTSSIVSEPRTNVDTSQITTASELPFANAIRRIPQETLTGTLYFGDLSVITARLPEDLDDLPVSNTILSALASMVTLPSEFTQSLTQPTEMERTSGVGIQHIERVITIYGSDGNPVNRQTWLLGRFNQSRIRRTLQSHDYQLVEPDLNEPVREHVQIWAKDGDIYNGMEMNLATRDPFFIYGGTLGQSFPLLISKDLILYTPDGDSLLSAAKTTVVSLADDPNMAALLHVIDQVTPEERGDLAQAIIGQPAWFRLNASQQTSIMAGETLERYGELPAYTFFALNHLYTAENTYATFHFIFQTKEAAEGAADVLEQRFANMTSRLNGLTIAEQLEGLAGERLPIFIVEAADRYVVIESFRFPLDDFTAGINFRRPYPLLFRWIQTMDTPWFTIDD